MGWSALKWWGILSWADCSQEMRALPQCLLLLVTRTSFPRPAQHFWRRLIVLPTAVLQYTTWHSPQHLSWISATSSCAVLKCSHIKATHTSLWTITWSMIIHYRLPWGPQGRFTVYSTRLGCCNNFQLRLHCTSWKMYQQRWRILVRLCVSYSMLLASQCLLTARAAYTKVNKFININILYNATCNIKHYCIYICRVIATISNTLALWD